MGVAMIYSKVEIATSAQISPAHENWNFENCCTPMFFGESSEAGTVYNNSQRFEIWDSTTLELKQTFKECLGMSPDDYIISSLIM